MPADKHAFSTSTPAQRFVIGEHLAQSPSGHEHLAEIASDEMESAEVRAAADRALPRSADRALLESVARSFLLADDPTLRWLGVQLCTNVGLFSLTPLVEALKGQAHEIGWFGSKNLGDLVEQALVLLHARRAEPSFGSDVT